MAGSGVIGRTLGSGKSSRPLLPVPRRVALSVVAYPDAGTYKGKVKIRDADRAMASIEATADAAPGNRIHLVCDVTDSGKLFAVEIGP